jgi:hypothetical protein
MGSLHLFRFSFAIIVKTYEILSIPIAFILRKLYLLTLALIGWSAILLRGGYNIISYLLIHIWYGITIIGSYLFNIISSIITVFYRVISHLLIHAWGGITTVGSFLYDILSTTILFCYRNLSNLIMNTFALGYGFVSFMFHGILNLLFGMERIITFTVVGLFTTVFF